MPMIDLTVPRGVLTPARTDYLIKELSRIIIHWEAAEDIPLYAYATRCYINEADGVAVAGKLHDPSKKPYYRVVVTVPQGKLNQERKRGVITDVTEAILRSEGPESDPRHAERVWVIINDVPHGDWGSGGQPRGVRELVELFGLDPHSERYRELRANARSRPRRVADMEQLTYLGPGRLEAREVPAPRLQGAGEALIEPLVVATCDLDGAIVRGRTPFAGPFPLGHEASAQ